MAPTVAAAMVFLTAGTALSLFMGWHLTASIGGADMPVVITVLNSYSGWALVAEGFMLNNFMLIAVGTLIGASGARLTKIMCDGMNRDLFSVIFGGFGTTAAIQQKSDKVQEATEVQAREVCSYLKDAQSVIIVPGYGLAVARAQHALAEVTSQLVAKGKKVAFGIHAVAGRMPGQMNVLLAEANISEAMTFEMEEINEKFPEADVALVVGANDIVNSAAVDDDSCPIAGMPVLHVWEAKQVVFMKRSLATGYANCDNPVFYNQNTGMFLGDAKDKLTELAEALRS
jgi:NAD/NADP transhydrogenase beta subunit